MAAYAKRKVQNQVIECNLRFEGLVQSTIRAKLTTEMIKYLVHQRGQIPLSYEQVKRDFEAAEKKRAERALSVRKGPQGLQVRQRKLAIGALEDIFQILEAVFNTGHPIKEVLCLFGSTIVSPKELYRIRFPVMCYDGKILSWTACRMALFQKLVSSDVYGDAKPLKTGTKLTVLVLASRESDLGSLGLIAKPMFKISHRGNHYAFNIGCQGKVINQDLSYVGEGYFDISGVEPLDLDTPTSTVESSRIASTPDHQHTPLTSLQRTRRSRPSKQSPGVQAKIPRLGSINELSPVEHSGNTLGVEERTGSVDQMDTANDHLQTNNVDLVNTMNDIISRSEELTLSNNEPEYIWFQLPVTMKGFRDRNSQIVSSTSHHR